MRNGLRLMTFGVVCIFSINHVWGALPVTSAVAHNCGYRGLYDFGASYSQRVFFAGAKTNLYSTVGRLDDSSTAFLGSTARIWATSAPCTVTHRWRNRATVETITAPEHPLLPDFAPYLASDVAYITVSNGAFALQMNYNPLVEVPSDEVIDAPAGKLYLGWLDTTTDPNNPQWVNAANKLRDGGRIGTDAKGPYQGSWSEFRASHTGALSNYLGYWGVEIDNNNSAYNNSVWAVVNTSGIYAVVPEPSSIVLLSVGLVGQMAWVWFRRRRLSRP